MKQALPPLTQHLLDAYTASALLCLSWLMGVIVRLGAASKNRRLNRFVSELERGVESILFLQALHRFGPPPQRRTIPRSTPPGFARQRAARLRLFFRNSGVRAHKANLQQRLAALAAAFANPEPHIAYFYARMLNGLRGPRLIPCAPPASTCARFAPSVVAYADSS